MARKSTPSFVLELPLRTTATDERALAIRLDAARKIYSAAPRSHARGRHHTFASGDSPWRQECPGFSQASARGGFTPLSHTQPMAEGLVALFSNMPAP